MGITIRTMTTVMGHSGKPERPSFFPIRAHLLTTCKAGGGIPPFSRAVRSSRSIRRMLLQRGQTMPQRFLAVIVCAVGRRLSPCLPFRCKPLSSAGTTCHPPAGNLPPAAFPQLWTMLYPHRPFSFAAPKETKPPLAGGRKDVKDYGDLSSGSKGREPWDGPFRLRGVGLFELQRHLQ